MDRLTNVETKQVVVVEEKNKEGMTLVQVRTTTTTMTVTITKTKASPPPTPVPSCNDSIFFPFFRPFLIHSEKVLLVLLTSVGYVA